MKKIKLFSSLLVLGLVSVGCGGSSEPSSLQTNALDRVETKSYKSLDSYLIDKTLYLANYTECDSIQAETVCVEQNYLGKMVFDHTLGFVNSSVLEGHDSGTSQKEDIRVDEKKITFINEYTGKDGGYLSLVAQTDAYLKFENFNKDAQKHLNDLKMSYGGVSNPQDIVILMGGKTFYESLYIVCKDGELDCRNADQLSKITYDKNVTKFDLLELQTDFYIAGIDRHREGDKFMFGAGFLEFTRQTSDYLLFIFYDRQDERDSRYDRRYYFDKSKAEAYHNLLKK